MAKTLLESKAPRCRTPFLEKNGDNTHCLGNPRWKNVPYFPQRARCQEVTTDIERAKAARIIAEFRAAEKLAANNDIAGLTSKIAQMERSGISQEAVEAQALRKDLVARDHQIYLASQDKIVTLIDEAAELVKPILDRCIQSYDDELNSTALQAEATMERLAFPLFTEQVNGMNLYKDGRQPGPGIKLWRLWERDECTCLHSCREVVRNLRQKFDGQAHYSALEIKRERAIPTMLYLCTSEDVASFAWL
jgi:hypothetical protein